jgi:hypothetical protein
MANDTFSVGVSCDRRVSVRPAMTQAPKTFCATSNSFTAP